MQPGIVIQKKDPGLGLVQIVDESPLLVGVSSSGPLNQLVTVSSLDDLLSTFVRGPLVDEAAMFLLDAGGPVSLLRVASAAGTHGIVTATGTGPAVTVGGTPDNDYEGIVKIVTGGAIATAAFQYSLDGGRTFSHTITTVATAYTLDGTGVTLTFATGAYVAGDTYSWKTVGPTMAAAALQAGLSASGVDATWGAITGKFATAAAAKAVADQLASSISAFNAQGKYVPFIIDAGADADTVTKTTYTTTSADIMPCYGRVWLALATPIVGRQYVNASVAVLHTLRVGVIKFSTSPGWRRLGPCRRVDSTRKDLGVPLSHDELEKKSMHDAGFSVITSVPRRTGYYINQGRLKVVPGSDYQRWDLTRLMNVAMGIVFDVGTNSVNEDMRANPDGKGGIFEADARLLDEEISRALISNLLDQKNDKGNPHCTSVDVRCDRSYDFQGTGILPVTVGIIPNGKAERLVFTIGLTKGARNG